MKKRTFCLFLTCVMLFAFATGCGSSSSNVAEKNDTEKKVLRVGMECAYAPFNWSQDSESVANGDTAVKIYGTNMYAYGYDVMMAKKLADAMGMELEIHKVEWSSIGLSMDAGEYDCIIAGMGKTAEREKSYSFTTPYYYRDNCVVVNSKSTFTSVKSLKDFAGKNVNVTTQLGTGWISIINQVPDGKTGTNYETTAECFMAISNGTADVCVIDVPTAKSAAMTNNDLTIITFDEGNGFVGDKEMTNVCIATRLNDTELRDKIQNTMDSLNWDKTKMDEMMNEAMKLQPSVK